MSSNNNDFLYAEPEDPDLPYKIYKKREFYYNRVPERGIMKTYDDIQDYRADICKIGDFQPREQQSILPNYINTNTPYKGVILMHGTGSGKCHKINTPLLMFDHSIKMIQDIRIEDLVMGDDGTSRMVLSLVTGKDMLYKIIPEENMADIYYVNSEHILCLYDTRTNNHVEILAKDFYNMKDKQYYRGYRTIIDDSFLSRRFLLLHKIIRDYCEKENDYHIITKCNEHKILDTIPYIVGSCGLYFKDNKIYNYKKLDIAYRYIYYKIDIEIDGYDNFYGISINKNNKYLLGDFTVTHNSCTAIAIAEQFKEQIKKYNTKIYVLVPGPNTRENFKKELLTCTGDTYLHNKNEFIQMTKAEIETQKKIATNAAMQNYKILSYKTFYKKVLGEKIQEKSVDMKHKSKYKKTSEGEYERETVINKITNMNNSILIVDEAHGLTDNEYGEALKKIIKDSENLRVILLTATPMINLPDEIVSLLNFIRPLDDQIERDKIFTSDKNYKMSLKPGGLKYLQEKANGYISFYRGNIPYTYAQRVEKGVIPNGLLFTPVVKCFMEDFQYNGYLASKQNLEDTLDRGSLAAANFVFPIIDDTKLIGHSSLEGINILISQVNEHYDKLMGLINKTIFKNKLSPDILKNFIVVNDKKNISGLILKLKYIKHFSIKFYKILNRIAKNVDGLKGPSTTFIYSNLVKAGGIELFAETMLQNGYLEYRDDGDYNIEDNTIDYKTGFTFREFKKKKLLNFKPATFLLITGGVEDSEDVPEIKQKLIQDVFNNADNIDGKHIKFILGSKVMNEGVTLKNCNQVHILDVFYNIPKIEQVIGRAIRMCVHQDVITDNNKFPKVYIYRYVIALNNKNTDELSTDELLYQKAEIKYIIVKQIERLLKEIAFDCPLLLHANIFPEELEKYKDCEPYSKNMKDPKNMCPALCDFNKCDLQCKSSELNKKYWDNKHKTYKKLEKKDLDYTTFNNDFAKYEINLIKNKIKDLYRFKYVYLYEEILHEIKKSFLNHQIELFDTIFLDKALDYLLPSTENEFNNFKDIIYDKFNRSGYLIHRDKYYIFQPFNENENLPAYYRNIIDLNIENHVSLNNYVKQKFPDIKYNDNQDIKETKEVSKYEFDLEYYNSREEYTVIGIIDKNNNKLASTDPDSFKIRPKMNVKNNKKRGTGIHSFTGAVCSTAKSMNELHSIIKSLPNITKEDLVNINKLSREEICNIIKNKLLLLEKYSTSDNKKITYMMVPKNHPTLPFPFNLQDRIKYTIEIINNIMGYSVDILVKKHKDIYYELEFTDNTNAQKHKNEIIKLGFNILNNKWKLTIS